MKITEKQAFFIERRGGWILIFVFTLFPVILWLTSIDLTEALGDRYSQLSIIAKMSAFSGYMLFAISLLLAVRRQWLEYFFEGLNRVYIAHHITGGLSLILLCLHPFFLALRYIDVSVLESFGDAARILLPQPIITTASGDEIQQALSLNAGIIAFIGMVVLLVLTFFVKLPYKLWLMTHRFLGVAFIFSLVHIVMIDGYTKTDIVMKVYLILWGVIGVFAFVYRTLLGNILVKKSFYKVVKVVATGTTTMIELAPIKKPLVFKAGQFIFVRFHFAESLGISTEAHPFSIASGPQENSVRLYVKALGDFTKQLIKLEAGAIAEVEGAYGRFVPAHYGTKEQVWIAGGIGITPFLSMARSIYAYPQKVHLVYSVVNRSEMVEETTLREFLPARFPNFSFIPYVTEEMDGKFLDAAYLAHMIGDLTDKEIFICGPPVMMKALRAQLVAMGVKKNRIHSEEFSIQ